MNMRAPRLFSFFFPSFFFFDFHDHVLFYTIHTHWLFYSFEKETLTRPNVEKSCPQRNLGSAVNFRAIFFSSERSFASFDCRIWCWSDTIIKPDIFRLEQKTEGREISDWWSESVTRKGSGLVIGFRWPNITLISIVVEVGGRGRRRMSDTRTDDLTFWWMAYIYARPVR